MSILGFLKKLIFTDDKPSNISFYRLYSNLSKWNESGIFPYESELPETITFPDDFHRRLDKLRQETLHDGLERGISIFWLDGDLVVSSVIIGDNKSVTINNNIRVNYLPTSKPDYFDKVVYVDDKVYSKERIYYKKIPKSVDLKYLFNLHTHPPHGDKTNPYYSFFSLQDLKSLLASGAIITGMIGSKIWLLVRTKKTPRELNNFEESEITEQSLINRLNIAVYHGEFYQKLVKIKSLTPKVSDGFVDQSDMPEVVE